VESALKANQAETPAIATRKAVAIKGLSKSFGATKALDDVSFDVNAGQIRGLIGENGAGKSTLLKLVSGLVKPDRGQIAIFDAAYQPRTPLDAHAFGVQTVFQELTLIEDLSVAQNLLLPNEPRGAFGLISGRASREKAEAILARFRVSDIDPDAEIRDLSLSDRQRIEIVRAVSRDPRLLLLDEATSALTSKDVGWLYSLVTNLRSESVGIIFISHRISEIRDLCGTISILRNGRHVVTEESASLSDSDIVRLVIGRSLANAFPPKSAIEGAWTIVADAARERPVLSGRNLCAGALLTDASFDLFPGQILGVAALDGMGQADLFSALFGASLIKGGAIHVDGRPVSLSSPHDAVSAGVGYVPSDRRREGVALSLSGMMNMSMPVLDTYARFGWIDRPRLKRDIEDFLARLEIHPRALYRAAGSFSGGNQQKFVIAKWLMAKRPILLMNDPTRGVDVGTKFEIFSIMRAFASAGGAILFYSTELTELVNMCDQVLVLYRGRFVRDLQQKELSEEALMQSVLGRDGHGAEVEV
jgi:ribose transport system ATP-binding protein